MTPPAPPTAIGPYILMEPIGTGATAQVFRAQDPRDGRDVALKLITDLDREANDRFLAEVAALRRVSHPGVVEILDAGEAEAGRWLAMELVEGRPLDEWVELVTGSTRLRRILRAGEQIAWALAAMHDNRILHRDLKPANILVGKRGRVVLVDFGFAAHLDRAAEFGAAGTLRYMAPERLTGATTDYRSDLFSLGVVLFELIARRAPHVGLDQHRLVLAQCTQPAPSIAEFAPEAPHAAVEVIDRLLAKPVAERPRSAGEVAAALRAALAETPRESTWRPSLRATPFVGHADLMANLLSKGRSDLRCTTILQGPSQIGLTRLLKELQGRLLVKGVLAILVPGGRRILSDLLDSLCGPLQPSDRRVARMGSDRDLLMAAWPELARPTEDIVSLTRVPTPADLMAAVRSVLGRVAASQRLAILIDDADRCDARDISLIEGFGLLLLATHEPARLSAAGERIPLPPLDVRRTSELARHLLGRAIGPAFVADHNAEIAGLPGRLMELARARGSGDDTSAGPDMRTARLRPWPNAIDEAERLLVEQGPRAALAVLEETGMRSPSPALQHRLALLRSRAAMQRGELHLAAEHAHVALEVAQQVRDRAEAHLALAIVMLLEGRNDELIELGTRASQQAQEDREPALAVRWGVLTARACHQEGRLGHARELLEALMASQAPNSTQHLGLSWTLTEVSVQQCDWQRARELMQATGEGSHGELGRRSRGGLRAEVGSYWLRQGEVAKANEQLERAWHDLARTEDRRLLATLLARFAEGRLMAGRVDEAGRLAREAINEASATSDLAATCEAYRVALRQARVAGDLSRLVELLPSSGALLEAHPTGFWGDVLAAQHALALASTGSSQDISPSLERARATSREDPYLRSTADLACLSLDLAAGRDRTADAAGLARRFHGRALLHLSCIATAMAVRGRPSATATIPSEREALTRGDRLAAAWLELARLDGRSGSSIARGTGLLGLLGPAPLAP